MARIEIYLTILTWNIIAPYFPIKINILVHKRETLSEEKI